MEGKEESRMKIWRKCPLLLLLAVSAVVVEAVGAANLDTAYAGYRAKTAMTPVLAVVFQGAREGKFPWKEEAESALAQGDPEEEEEPAGTEGVPETEPTEESGDAAQETAEGAEETGDAAQETAKGAEETGGEKAAAETVAETETAEGASEGDEKTQEAPEEEEETWEFCRVEEDYFDDALFIGDSRTQGLLEYGGIEDRAAFYCQTSLTVYDLFAKDKAFIREEGEKEKLTLTQALQRHQFGKIYLMIGINEMGTGTPESFFEEYARAVYRIRQLQPDAIVFVQAIMRVAGEKNATDPIFNNTNINIRNVEIATLEDKKDIFYLDVNEAVCDESGNLHGDWTFDQIHLKAKYYEVWKEFLLDHGIVREKSG